MAQQRKKESVNYTEMIDKVESEQNVFKVPTTQHTDNNTLSIDFTALKRRCNSTSTPFVSHSNKNLVVSPTDDSGFDEIKGSLFDSHDSNNTNTSNNTSTDSDSILPVPCSAQYNPDTFDIFTPAANFTLDNIPKYLTRSTVSLKHSTRCRTDSGIESLSYNQLDDSIDDKQSIPWEERLMKEFAPRVPDRIIGRKIGLEQVDVLDELDQRNISCVKEILNYLSPADLCRMCLVSKGWKSICQKNHTVNERRVTYLENRKQYYQRRGVENKKRKKSPTKSSPPRGLTSAVVPLGSLQKTGKPVSPLKDTPLTNRFQVFIQEGSHLRYGESQRKCPKCSSPSKFLMIEERGHCSSERCRYDFCTRCLNDFHGSKPCAALSVKRTSAVTVGSKKSKKNLRRL